MLGTTLNTHCQWIGQQLFSLGMRVERQTTVPDGEAIFEALKESIERADVVLVTGGLGPTSDDITREATAAVLGLELMQDEAALRSLEQFFAVRNKEMVAENLKQAEVLVGADVIPNPNGTAPGMYVPPRLNGRSHCAVFLLPGPPRELQPMFDAEVGPRLRSLVGDSELAEIAELKFTGLGESEIHHQVDESMANIADLEVGYCARLAEVDVRLIGSPKAIAAGRAIVMQKFAEFCFSDDGSSLEEVVVREFLMREMTLSLAESCTGGLIANRVTDVPGASAVLTHGFVTYSNAAKMDVLGVQANTLESYGAVSAEVASEMAEGALRVSGADVALAVTGIAGPSGAVEGKPVGTVFLALAGKGRPVQVAQSFHPRDRVGFKRAVSQAGLELLRRAALDRPL